MLKVLKMHPEEDKRVLYHLLIERGKKYRYQKSSQVSLLRLSFSSSLFGRFYFMHSLRSKFLHRSIKKMSEIFWKWKKLEQLFENFWDFFRSKIFENFRSQIFSFSYNFQCFFFRKISKFFRSKNSIFFHWKLYENDFF